MEAQQRSSVIATPVCTSHVRKACQHINSIW